MTKEDRAEDFVIQAVYPSGDWSKQIEHKINKANQIYFLDYRMGAWFISVSEYDWETDKWSDPRELKGYVQNIVDFFVYAWGHIRQMKNHWDTDTAMDEYAKAIGQASLLRKTMSQKQIEGATIMKTEIYRNDRVCVHGKVYFGNAWREINSKGVVTEVRSKSMLVTLDSIDEDEKVSVIVRDKYVCKSNPLEDVKNIHVDDYVDIRCKNMDYRIDGTVTDITDTALLLNWDEGKYEWINFDEIDNIK